MSPQVSRSGEMGAAKPADHVASSLQVGEPCRVSRSETSPANGPIAHVAYTPSAQPAQPRGPLRAVWAAIILLAAVPVGSAAGLLSVVGGVSVPLAILTGAGAFGGTVALLLALAQFLTSDHAR
jgi:hypothetical protein